ncbi:MAG: response regulator [Alphaproteobacteria bacterium]|nr:response regulator [Alphaproteobacteria bacterium]
MDGLAERLMGIFAAEWRERLAAMDRDLVALEQASSPEHQSQLLASLFRAAHSLKGAAGSVGVAAVEAACHALEETLSAIRNGKRALDAGAVEMLFVGADAIAAAGAGLSPEQPKTAKGVVPASPIEPNSAVLPGCSIAPPQEATVRIAASKLDAMLARGGELIVAHYRAQARAGDADAVQNLLGRAGRDCSAVERLLKGSSDGLNKLGTAAERALAGVADLRNVIARAGREVERLSACLAADSAIVERAARAVLEQTSQARLLGCGEAWAGLDRIVRDLARTAGKSVRLTTRGDRIEIDREIVERLRDPLIHLARNAIDHGIEPPGERKTSGKPAEGEISITASVEGGILEIVVADDGRGLGIAEIRAAAAEKNLPEGSDEELANHIFRPGFSTRKKATGISGRGVGLDAVKAAIEQLRGSVEVSFEPGCGTRFHLRLPLTLTQVRVLLVRSCSEIVAFDVTDIVRSLRIPAGHPASIPGGDIMTAEGPLPLARLDAILGFVPDPAAAVPPHATVLILRSGGRHAGFVVDELVGEQEIIVRPLGRRLRCVRQVAGGSVLATGRVVLLLKAGELIETALSVAPSLAAPVLSAGPPAPRRRVLLAEDSPTMRNLEQSILEAAGYEVASYADGASAWTALQRAGADIVVSDVDMPGMSGFELVESMRRTPRFRELPVVLVTSCESESERSRGLALGADAYLAKSAFDRDTLIASLRRFV